MGVVANEPSMEEILSSIKRIIGEGADGKPARAARRRNGAAEETPASDVEFFDPSALGPEEVAEESADDVEFFDPSALREEDEMETDDQSEILELTERAESPAPKASAKPAPAVAPAVTQDPASAPILSDSSAAAARIALSQLSTLLIRPEQGEALTLEALVREMLRPVLKEWLEANLPDLVETMVKKEIDRIVGRLG